MGYRLFPACSRERTEAKESEPIRPVSKGHITAIKDHISRQIWALIQL